MSFYSRRKRLEELAAREAAGESLWTDEFDDRARTKLYHAVDDAWKLETYGKNAVELARGLLLRDEGLFFLVSNRAAPIPDFLDFFLQASDDVLPSAVEAFHYAMLQNGYESTASGFSRVVNMVLSEHRISFELIDGQMVPFESKELHTEVVEPTLRLLSGRQGWDAVESAYQKALEEIGDDASDAITDAGRALQEALKLLGCEGNALGPLISDARRKGLLGPHDSKLTEGVQKFMTWVSADRSEYGDSHKDVGPTSDDAWLAVHVVGALILRLAGPPRGES